MLEKELFELLEQTADAAFCVTEQGAICSWNRSAERMFGYAVNDVLGRNTGDVFDAWDSLGTEPLAGSHAVVRDPDVHGSGIPNFDLNVRTASGTRLWVNVSTVVFRNRRTGRTLLVRLARDISQHRLNAALLSRLLDAARQVVALADDESHHAPIEALSAQEHRILQLFADGGSAADIAGELLISSQTLRNHLHHINRKLRTHNRLEAVTHARRRGLID